MDYNRGLYFQNELECQRAMAILQEQGFSSIQMALLSPFEATLQLQNKQMGDRAIQHFKYVTKCFGNL